MKRLNKKGFTLVELLAVIVILALLMVVVASTIGGVQDNAKKSALRTEAKKIFNGVFTEAKSSIIVTSPLVITDGKIGSYNGKDGSDFTYDITVDKTTGALSGKICYQKSYYMIAKVDKNGTLTFADSAAANATYSSEGTVIEADGTCSGTIS